MKTKITLLIIVLSLSITSYSQLGIRGGINMANEIRSFNKTELQNAFQSNNLTGYQIGLVYQLNPIKSGLGFETGILLSQKGSTFKFDSTSVVKSFVKAYQEINYIEVPLNFRYRINLIGFGIYGSAGIYGDYALNGKSVFDSQVITDIKTAKNFDDFASRLDYGYSLGCGVELLKKIQIGATWSQGLRKKDADKSFTDKITTSDGTQVPNLEVTTKSKAFTVSLTYLF